MAAMDFSEAHLNRCSKVGLACRLGNVEWLESLLTAGAPVDVRDNRGWYPIHEAAYGLHAECAKMLIERGKADPNVRSHDGSTPLLLLCQMKPSNGADTRALDFATCLLDAKADPNLGSFDEMSPLIAAIKSKNRALIELLLAREASHHQTWYKGWTALHEAAAVGDYATAVDLLKLGVDPFAVDEDGNSALFVASQEDRPECVQLLLTSAGDRAAELANITNRSDGGSCVYAASSEGYVECVRMLVEAGADVDLTVRPVWDGPIGDGNEMDQQLPTTSTDVRDSAGIPPPRLVREYSGVHPAAPAAQKNFYKCLEIIMPRVDVNKLNGTLLDPLAMAAAAGNARCLSILLQHHLPIDRFSDAPTNTLLISFLKPIFQRPYYTALREAVRKGHVDCVELLLQAGASMVFNDTCYSPFLFAFRNRLPSKTVRLFMEHGVPLNFTSSESIVDVPDVLLAVLGRENRQQLINLLKCGLAPKLENWCACHNTRSPAYSLLREVKDLDYIGDTCALLSILFAFSPFIPRCCDEWKDIRSFSPPVTVSSLGHLARLRVRECVRPGDLMRDSWPDLIFAMPQKLKDQLTFVG